MIYKRVEPYTQEQAEKVFAHGTRAEIIDALLGVTYYVKDWRWVQNACLALLARPECGVQWSAIQCLGHLATFHRVLDFAVVLPAIQPHLSDPALAPVLYDALGDMVGVEDTSYFEQYWETLPQRIRDVLIEEGIFNSLGRRVRKRNFLTAWKNDATWQHSPDQETLERLKRQLKADSATSAKIHTSRSLLQILFKKALRLF